MFKCETCKQFYLWVTIPLNIDSLHIAIVDVIDWW